MLLYRIQHKDNGLGPWAAVEHQTFGNIPGSNERRPFWENKPHYPDEGPYLRLFGHKIAVKSKRAIRMWFRYHLDILERYGFVVAIYDEKPVERGGWSQVAIKQNAKPIKIVAISEFMKSKLSDIIG